MIVRRRRVAARSWCVLRGSIEHPKSDDLLVQFRHEVDVDLGIAVTLVTTEHRAQDIVVRMNRDDGEAGLQETVDGQRHFWRGERREGQVDGIEGAVGGSVNEGR